MEPDQTPALEKVYEPQRFEPHWANWWVESGIFHAEAKPGEPYFSLVIPPPNVTGALHIGHMFEHTIIDAQVRWQRMLGVNTLWLPGTDHAGISTQIMVERKLAEEGLTKHDLGREKFLERAWAWKEEYGGRILEQMKRVGDSVDWSRLAFTMDPQRSRAVREAFVRLYEKGLIYRAEYMVNWCPRCMTALSDLEAIPEETDGHLWHIRYPVNGSDLKLVVATTRPETMLGDTAIAIHPSDKRAKDLAGKTARVPLTDRDIPIVLDAMADPEFGSGAVKITPAHDLNDFEAGKRHNLPSIKVIDENAKMTGEAGRFAGIDRFDARKQVVAELEKLGLLEKIEPHKLSLRRCQRCRTVVEPLVSMQWWMKMKPLAEPAIRAVKDTPKRIEFVPENWEKTYLNWLENIRDWCVSRQLWWGHRIPAWHCKDCKHTTVSRETPAACAKCGSVTIEQETDVLDTWFSSGLWPLSTLGWPDETVDLKAFYPTTLLVTGFDIIFFWAARMIMLGMEMTGEVPFRQVHIHGLVRDAERQKMSKMKGNVVDPLVLNDKYGTDAVRFGLLVAAAPGNDIALSEEVTARGRNFANKIWNASRLLFTKSAEGSGKAEMLADRWIASRLNACAEQTNRAFAVHRYHEAADAIWTFFWDDFCDWYLELKKLDADWSFAYVVYEKALRLLHPLMPFLTEELWQRLQEPVRQPGKSIALAAYPRADATAYAPDAQSAMGVLQKVVTEIRQRRAAQKIDKSQAVKAAVTSPTSTYEAIWQNRKAIERLANATMTISVEGADEAVSVILDIPVDEARLRKENEQLKKVIENSRRQLGNAEIVAKMPEKVVATLRAKLADYEAQLERNLDALGES
jgi:valyl-tRNA synthetase